MLNKRTLIIIGGIVLLFAFIFFMGIRQVINNTVPKSSVSIQYTNPVTGQNNTDITSEAFDQAPQALNKTVATIDGYEAVYSSLTSEQASNAQSILNDFLMARSGLDNVNASIQTSSLTADGNHVQFLMVVNRPPATYQVNISVANQFQGIPTVEIRKVDE